MTYPPKLVGPLYRIEHLTDAPEPTPDDRAALRQERSAPILETLCRRCVVACANEPPSTALAKAAGYMVNHWEALSRFLKDGWIDLANNCC